MPFWHWLGIASEFGPFTGCLTPHKFLIQSLGQRQRLLVNLAVRQYPFDQPHVGELVASEENLLKQSNRHLKEMNAGWCDKRQNHPPPAALLAARRQVRTTSQNTCCGRTIPRVVLAETLMVKSPLGFHDVRNRKTLVCGPYYAMADDLPAIGVVGSNAVDERAKYHWSV